MDNIFRFEVDDSLCIGCSRCIKVCPAGILRLNDEYHARMISDASSAETACWQCEHCLSVCPRGAIHLFGKDPEGSLPPPEEEVASRIFEALLMNRRSHRRFLDRDIDPFIPARMLDLLANAPNKRNLQHVEYTLLDDRVKTARFRDQANSMMEILVAEGIFPAGCARSAHSISSDPDPLFHGAPYLLFPHASFDDKDAEKDVLIAAAYFELLCASRGLAAVVMTEPLDWLSLMPEVYSLLDIPESHIVPVAIGFGLPEIPYARGTQRHTPPGRIHRPDIPE